MTHNFISVLSLPLYLCDIYTLTYMITLTLNQLLDDVNCQTMRKKEREKQRYFTQQIERDNRRKRDKNRHWKSVGVRKTASDCESGNNFHTIEDFR